MAVDYGSYCNASFYLKILQIFRIIRLPKCRYFEGSLQNVSYLSGVRVKYDIYKKNEILFGTFIKNLKDKLWLNFAYFVFMGSYLKIFQISDHRIFGPCSRPETGSDTKYDIRQQTGYPSK